MNATEWLLLTTLAVVWGGSFFFAAVAVTELPPMTVAFIRVSGAALVLWAVLLISGGAVPRDMRLWSALFVMGLLNNVIPFSLIFWAQTDIASGLASILNATTPIFTVLVAHLWTVDEKLTAPRAAGVALGFAGVVLIFSGRLGGGSGYLAMLAVLLAAVSYAFASVYGKRFAGLGAVPMVAAAGQVTASAIILLPVILIFDQPMQLQMPSLATIWSLVGLVVLSTALAYFLFFRILATAGATNLMLVTLLVPVSAILLGVVFLAEVISVSQICGMALIGLGLLAIDGRVVRWFSRG